MTSLNRAERRRPLPAKKHFKKMNIAETEPEKCADESLEGLQARVQELVDTFKFEEAREVCSRVVQLDPENADVQYLMGTICLELGDFMNGFEHIRTSIHLQPDTTPDRFFAFAQLLSGADALQVYEHGLGVYNNLLSSAEGATVSAEMAKKVSTACCSAAEIFMTDLCDEETAEVSCQEWLDRAHQICPENAEYFRVLADLRMCQERQEEAYVAVKEAVRLWSAELERILNPVEGEGDNLIASFELPSYESRIAAVKILIELSQFDSAVEVSEQLLKEDDSVIMTWYLLCLALKMRPVQEDSDALKDAIQGALRVGRREQLLNTETLQTEDELISEILAMAREIGLPLDNLEELEAEDAEAEVMELDEIIAEAEKTLEN